MTTLEGGEGNDDLFGGLDNDRYVFAGKQLGKDEILTTNGSNAIDLKDHPLPRQRLI